MIRTLARIGAASVLGGALGGAAAGLAARTAMRIIAELNPHATGAFTANGNQIGDITLGGTAGLVGFAVFTGAVLGGLYAVVREWLPGPRGRRGLLFGCWLLAALASPFVIEGDNIDFAILGDDEASVGMLLITPLVYGAVLGIVADRLAPPGPAWLRARPVRAAGLLALAGAAVWGLVRLVDALRTIFT